MRPSLPGSSAARLSGSLLRPLAVPVLVLLPLCAFTPEGSPRMPFVAGVSAGACRAGALDDRLWGAASDDGNRERPIGSKVAAPSIGATTGETTTPSIAAVDRRGATVCATRLRFAAVSVELEARFATVDLGAGLVSVVAAD